jgi:transposase
VHLMAPSYVQPYGKSGKNDAHDAEAIGDAVKRHSMRFVAVKTAEQQSTLVLHRLRQHKMSRRGALIKQVRALLDEFGIIAPQGAHQLHSTHPTSWTTPLVRYLHRRDRRRHGFAITCSTSKQ